MKTLTAFILFSLSALPAFAAEPPVAIDLIKSAIDNYRGLNSYSEASMTIHRKEWQRVVEMKVWTQDLDKSLVRVTAPKKDKDAGTLLIGDDMWSYAPKINRIIKIPGSMSNQSWMGSDFSNNDIARADDIIDQYTHRIINTSTENNKKIYTIESVPHEDAPVVWGKEILRVNEDFVFLEHQFYDQDNQLVKTLIASEIKLIDGKYISLRQRMTKTDNKEEWTEFHTSTIKFNIEFSSNTFTLSNLRNPR